MLVYLNSIYKFIYSFISKDEEEIKFEKPRGYKNVASNEMLHLKRKKSYYPYSR